MLPIWSFSTSTRSVEVRMHFVRFESKSVATEISLMLLMRNSQLLQPLQASLPTLVSMHCGRNSQPWSGLKHERRWRLLVNARVSFHLSVSTISLILLHPFALITRRTQPLLRNSVFVNTSNLPKNTFPQLRRMWRIKFQNFWKRLKRHGKTSQTIAHLLMSIEVGNTHTTFEASHSQFKPRPNRWLIPTFRVLHCQPLLMMENCLNGSVKKMLQVISHTLQACSHSSEPTN